MKYRLIPWVSLSCLVVSLAPSVANSIDPTPTVVTGQVDFIGLDTHSALINQTTQKAIVDYSHFNIPEGGSVQFVQPNSNAAILNRITGADPSLLNGTLTANGQVFFVNPAGVTFGANSVIRADVFMAAAGQMSNEDFLNNIQNFSLTGDIQTSGSIETERGVGLFGQKVENLGVIVSKNGYAIVASGDEVHVRQGGTGLSVDVTDSAEGSKSGSGIKNLGTVNGEDVMFSAGDAFATAIQHSGTINARKSAKILSNGGVVDVSGEITARNEAGQGGRIEVGGTDLGADSAPVASQTTIAKTAVLDASSGSGDGGHIVVYSGGHTQFDGLAKATSSTGNGGFIEASGKTLDFDNMVESILLESGGHFLIDPEEVTIDTDPENPFNASAIETLLDSGASFEVMTTSSLPGNGNINVDANIQVPTNNRGDQGSLTLDADGDIIVAGGVTVENLQEDFAPGETVFDFKAGGNIILNGDVRHSGINGEVGRGTIEMAAGGEVFLNNTIIDANGGSVIIDAQKLTLSGFSGGILSGLAGENTASIDITATNEVNFAGGNIQTFGGSDIFIDTGLLTNNTGSTAIARTDLAESFFGIRLLNPEGNGIGTNHIYGGIQSGARALFNVPEFDAVKTTGITGNQYFYDLKPTVGITAKDGSKIYGNTFNLSTGGAAVDVAIGDFVPVPLGDPFIADTTSNALDLIGVTTTSTGAVGAADVGTNDIIANGAVSNNGYSFGYTMGTLTVDPRAVTLTADQQNKQYGDELTLDGTVFTITDLNGTNILPNGDDVISVDLNSASGVASSTTSDVAPYADEIVITGQTGNGSFQASNYEITYETGDLVVDPRNVTVTASDQDKFYGDVLDLTSNASETAFRVVDNGLTDADDDSATLPNGEAINTVALQSVLPVDVAASTTEGVATYSDELRIIGVRGGATFDLDNYNLTFVEGDLVVNPRPITLTPDAQSKEYGEVLPLGTTAFTLVDNGLTEGGDAVLPNGEQIDTVTLVSNSGIAASTDADAGSYNANIGIDGNAFSSADGSNGFIADNYDVTFESRYLTIDPRQIELIAGRQEKFYGDGLALDNTSFAVIDQGNALDNALPNGEEVTSVAISSATGVDNSTTSDATVYSNEIVIESPVTGTPGTGDGFLESNYNITFTEGDLLIKQRPITVTPLAQEKIYGDALVLSNDNTTFTVTDLDNDAALPNGEIIDTVSIISRGGNDASTISDAVTYRDDLEIAAFETGSNGFNPDNYTFDFSNLGDFVINRRAAQIIASAQEKDYGDVHDLGNTAFTVVDRDGGALPNGETVDTVTLVSADGVDASTDADAVLYADNISVTPTSTNDATIAGSANFNQENYTFSYDTGDFTINRRAITLTANQQEKIYGDQLALDDAVFTTLDKDGDAVLPNDEVVTNVTINSATGVDASTTSDVANYVDEIEISGPVVGIDGSGDGFLESNYDITYVAGDLSVNKRAITVTPSRQEKVYGDQLILDDTAFTVIDLDNDSTLPNGEVIETVSVISRGEHDTSTTSNAVTYQDDLEITEFETGSNGFDSNNYSFDFSNLGDFVINRRAAQIIASAQEKDYGDVHDLGNTAFTVVDRDGGALPNGETVDTVTLVSADGVDASTDADAVLYADNISVTPTSTNDATIAGSANFNQENYTFSYDTGDFTINRRAITLTANQQEKIYGDQLALDDTVFTTLDKDGDAVLPNDEVVTNVTINSATGVDASTTSDVANYVDEIEISGPVVGIDGSGDGFLESNYDITYVAGDLSVNKRAITVTPSRQEKVYGDQLILDDTAFTVIDLDNDSTLPNGEVIETVSVISRGEHDTSTTSNAVTYQDDLEITEFETGSNGFDSNNYSFDFSNLGDFVINRRAAQIIASAQEKDYGDVHDLGNTAFTVVDRDGGALPNGETVDTVTLVSADGVDASTDADAVLYADNISVTPTSTNDATIAGSANFNQENYTFSYDTGDFTINRRAITLTANQQEKIYGDQLALDDTVFTTLDKDGDAVLPNDEVVTNVTINSATGVDASTTSDVANYVDEIEISGPVAGTDGSGDGFLESNYDITYVSGDLAVNRRAAQIIASAQEKDYGDMHDLGDTAFTVVDRDGGSLPNGETVNTVTLVSENGVDASTDADVVLYADNISVTPTSTNDATIAGSANFNQENYTFSYDTGDFTINRRAITLTANQQEKIYGDQLALDDTVFTTLDKDGDAVLPNDEVVTNVTINSATGVDASTTSDVANYVDEIEISGPVAGTDGSGDGFLESNYDITYVSGDLAVNRRAAQIIASAQEKDYGDVHDLGNTAFTVVDRDGGALPNGETVDTVTLVSENGVDASTDANAVLYADNISVTPTSTNDATIAGSANFNQENYSFSYGTGDLAVNRRAAQIIASAQEKDYGDVHDLGDVAFTVVDRDGGSLPNGETVNTVTLVSENGIDASTDANAVLYADNISVTPTSTNDATIAGSANFNQENYSFSYGTGDLAVNRRAAQIIASAQEKDYGDVHDLGNTAFTVVDRDGGALPNGETVNTVTFVSANGVDASTDTNAVLYADNISVTPTSANDPTIAGSANFNQENYTFSYVTGDLTVNRRAAQIIASAQEKDYGDVHDLGDVAFTVVDRDGGALPNGETVNTVTLVSADGVDASTDANAVLYADNISVTPTSTNDATIAGSANFNQENYTFSYGTGDLTVNRRAAQIIASAQEKDYGDVHDLDDVAFTVVDRDGGSLPNGETVNTVTLVSENGIDASTDANAVLYADNISVTPTSTNDATIAGSANFNQENYSFSYGTGDLAVNRRAAQIIASAQEKDYGDVHDLGNTAFTVVDRDGGALPNGETVDTVTLVSADGVDASTDADAVLYADNISVTPTSTNDATIAGSANFNQENYTFSYDTGDFTINRRAITLTANQQEKIYGDQLALDDTVFTTLDKDGDAVLPNDEVVTNVTINSATGVDASTTSDVANYVDEIEISGPVAGTDGSGDGFLESNYDITYVAGDLSVNKRAITVTPSRQEKVYGDQLILDDTAFTVIDLDNDSTLPNGEVIETVSVISRGEHDTSTTSNAVTYQDDLEITEFETGSNGFDSNNYSFDFSNLGDFVINRRAAQIIASAQEKDYGDVHDLGNTAFTVVDRDGGALPNGETVDTVTLVSADGVDASTDADAVLYADNISVTPTSTNDATIAGSANFNQENYTFSYGTGDLTVNRRAAQIIASAQEKDYGDVHDLGDVAFTVVDRDGGALPNGETVDTVTLVSANGVDASTDADAVLYADNISVTPTSTNDATIAGSANFNQENYSFSYGTGDLAVNRRAAQIIASAQEKDYGDVHDLGDVAFTVVDRDGGSLPNGETVNTVTLVSENGIDASTDANAVLYADNISVTPTSTNDATIAGSANFNQENYSFSYGTGDLAVNRRAAQIIASAQEKDYGDVHDLGNTAFTVVDRDGGALPNGETVDTVTLVSADGVDASTDADAVLYADNISVTPTSTNDATIAGSANFNQENYTFSYDTGDFTINRRAITLTANQQEKIYGDQLALDDTVFTTLDKDGDAVLPNDEVVTNVTINSATGVDASTTSDVANYVDEIEILGPVVGIDGSGDGFLESNYDITYVAGDLSVNKRAITVTPSRQEKVYGDQLILDDTAFTVIDLDNDSTLPNGEVIETVSVISRGEHDTSTTSNAVTYQDDLEITEFETGSNGFDSNNYSFDFSNLGDFVINRRAAQIIASAQEKDYGDVHDLGNTAFTVVDRDGGALPNGETVDTVTLVSADGVDASTDADAVLYADNISVTPTSTNDATIAGSANFNQENYTFSYDTGDFTINRRAITLTANQQEKIYGDQLALDDTVFTTLDKDGDAVLPNDEVVTNVTINSATGVDASTTSDVANYVDEIEISGPVVGIDGSGDGFLESNYDITYVAGDLSVNKRAITVTPSRQEKVYGDQLILDDTAFTVIDLDNDSTLPNGEVIETVSVISRGEHDTSTTSNAVTYQDDLEITEFETGSNGFDSNNYSFDFSNLGDFVINRRAAQIIASAQEKDYGDVHDLGNTAFTVVDRDGGALPNGETVDTVTLVSADGVDASTDADAVLYADNISVTPTSTNDATIAGSANFNQENYTFSYDTGDFTINRRAITLTANQQEKIYGDQLALDDTVFTTLDKDGDAVLPNDEVVTNVTINSATGVDASTTSDVANYVDEIEISGPVVGIDGSGDGFLESNYDITYVAGDLSVNKRAITVTPSRQEKVYGDQLILDDTAFTVIDLDNDSTLPNGEVIETVSVISRGEHDTSTTSNAVTYQDDLEITEFETGSNGFDSNNYSFDFSNLGDFVINRRAAQIIASAQEKDYGDVHDLGNTAFTVVDRDGGALPNGETVDTVTLVSADGVDASTDADAVLYADNISVTPTSTNDATIAGSANFNQENYTFSYDTGDFTINRRAITLTANQQEKIYGDQLALDDAVFTTLDKDGDAVLPNDEVVTNVTINSATGVDASTTSDVANYVDEIEISGPVVGIDGSGDGFLESNYDITYVAGDLSVNKRAITVTALPQSRIYGELVTPDTSTFAVVDLNGGSVLPNSETINSMTITSNVADDSIANVGIYTDDLAPRDILTSSNGFDENNYEITRVSGDFTIDQRSILLTAIDQEKIYGNSEILDDAKFSVTDTFGGGGSALPNGETVNTVSFNSTSVPGDTKAAVGVYTDDLSIADQVGSNGFAASNYDISYAPGDYTVDRRSIELIIAGDNRFAGADYQIDPAAFATIDLDGDALLPNDESINTLNITSLSGVAEDPSSSMGLYTDELDADPASAIGSNGFSLVNYNITITPGDFKIDPYPGLPSMAQDVYFEQWLRDNTGLDLEDPFSNSYAISQSLGLRLITLDSWLTLSGTKKQLVLSSLDAVPLRLQSFDLAEELIKGAKQSNKN